MNGQAANAKMVTALLFRLLPVQVLLAAVAAVNGVVSGLFASNYVGVAAMSAVGLYSPLNMLIGAISTMLVGGSVILCGKYLGRSEYEKLRRNFSLNVLITFAVAAVFTALFLVMGLFGLTGLLTHDEAIRPLFGRYLMGQAAGVLPLMMGNLLAAFVSLENRQTLTTVASAVHIAVNLALHYLFVKVLAMEELGLALATALGSWVFMLIEASYFFSRGTDLHLTFRRLPWREAGAIVKVGFPGAASSGYQTVRGLVLNRLIEANVGSVGISAYAATDNLLKIFWAIPTGMLAVSRLMISVCIGEEDRQSLTDVMRVMLKRFVPLMYVVALAIILCAGPLARLFYSDTAQEVYRMTEQGVRIIPLCMPLSIIMMHFVCYGQASGKQGLVHTLSLLDGVVCVVGFAAAAVGTWKMPGVYAASVFNGIVTTLVVIGYAWVKNRRFPRDVEELLVLPPDFGAQESERMDISVRSMEDVVSVARRVQDFCRERGIDERRGYLSGLCMEEMAGNIVDHGFTKDRKRHSVDVRVVHRGDDVILRIKDDCVPFDPRKRKEMTEGGDPAKNIGIRMIYAMASEVEYRNILGLNVLTIRI